MIVARTCNPHLNGGRLPVQERLNFELGVFAALEQPLHHPSHPTAPQVHGGPQVARTQHAKDMVLFNGHLGRSHEVVGGR